MSTVTATNLANLTAYPLASQGASVDNDNIQKLRTFAISDIRRYWSVANSEINDSIFLRRDYASRRWYSSATISS